MTTVCIFHEDCTDGFGGAWVVSRALGRDVEFVRGVYGQPFPDVAGKDVILVDFSYKRDVMEQLIQAAKSVLVLDHHKSAMHELAGLATDDGQVTIRFDLGHSGAMLAWLHFFPGQPAPQLLQHLEDRDLWKFKLPKTQELHTALDSYPATFEVWDELMLTTPLALLEQEGVALERQRKKDIARYLERDTRMMTVAGFHVPVVNMPRSMASDGATLLAQGHPFAVAYFDSRTGRRLSFRSAANGLDVSEIAALFNGNGHTHAAGCTLTAEQAARWERTGALCGAQADETRAADELAFVLANGLPIHREGRYRYHGVAEPVWHTSARAAIRAAMQDHQADFVR